MTQESGTVNKERNAHLKAMDVSAVWHPFTQMQEYALEEPIIISSATGVRLTDIDGNTYLDGYSSMWCNVHGHQVPEIDDAIRSQLSQVAHSTLLGLSNIPAIELAEKLVEISPEGLNRVFYSDTGACAVEIALKMAFQYWQQRTDPRPEKTTFLHLNGSYHGDTLGAISVGGIDLFHRIYHPLLFPTLSAPAPNPYRCSFCADESQCNQGCNIAIEEILKRDGHRIAACIVEPLVQGAGGMLIHPSGYLDRIAQLCKAHDVLLIVDEIATGFGRTGTMFACDQENVCPDLMCLGKGLTGGYLPVAATLATDEIYEAFLGDHSEARTFYHGHTFTGNPLGCAAALATISKFEKDGTVEALQPKIAHLSKHLSRFSELDSVGDVRQCGFIAAIELVADRTSKRPFPAEDRVGARVCAEARRRGLLVRPLGDTIVIMPPLVIDLPDLDTVLQIIREAILAVTGEITSG
jgi:adenosylmethionine-8-amino-7-oxononanoate aminotransferase